MKLNKQLAALKKQTGIKAGAPKPSSTSSTPLPIRRWAILGLLLLVAGAGTWAVFEFFIWSTVPPELVGKWVVTEGPDEGGTIDFYRNGTMVAVVNLGGKKGIVDARVRVEGKKIYATVRHQQTGEEGTRIQTIKVLQADRLVLEDEKGNSINLERAR